MSEGLALRNAELTKAPTGIRGFDEITGGGLPRGRPTLVCGGPGCGKTLFGMEFLVRGALDHGEPGALVSFEETALDLAKNVASLGFDLHALVEQKKLAIDHVRVERSEIEETGEYDLEGLFVRLAYVVGSVGAKRVVLDTIESLFAAFSNEGILRAELRRLFGWLRERGLTTVITGERGDGALTRHGLEEYVSDCVILLDQRVHDQVATRRLRVVKYRGSSHGTNEYPFLIHEKGFAVLPATSLGLTHVAPTERVSLGIPRLDEMLGGQGIYRGSSVLLSGTAGSGKTSLAAHAAAAACRRGEHCLYFAFEESQSQILRNMRSIGVDLAPWVDSGLLSFHTSRPMVYGLEMHLAVMHEQIEQAKPGLVIIDPMTNLQSVGSRLDITAMLVRLLDLLKSRAVTAIFTSLTASGENLEETEVGVSSLMDTWLLVRILEGNGERNRGLYVLKARGTAHSNQIREFVISERGVELLDVYTGAAGVLTGSARKTQEALERAAAASRQQDLERRQRELVRKRKAVSAQIVAMQAELDAADEDLRALRQAEGDREAELARDRDEIARMRQADAVNGSGGEPR
jgi:circadian clock protein KaiC